MSQKESALLDRFRVSLGRDVSVDYFLYVCLETERFLRAKGITEGFWDKASSEEWLSQLSEGQVSRVAPRTLRLVHCQSSQPCR
jgi:hypothetical protein